MNTRIDYRYRDNSNYKAHHSVVLKGGLSDDEIQEMFNATEAEMEHGFIPEEVGLPELQEQMVTALSSADDNVWHELETVDRTAVPHDPQMPTAHEMLSRFLQAKWDVLKACERLGI